jgi:ribonuclease HI
MTTAPPTQSAAELIQIYTDGSAHYKTRYGAWAFIVVHPDKREESFSGHYENVTNNIMELMAVIEAMNYVVEHHAKEVKPFRYEIISDSEYVVNGVNEWIVGWKAKNWKNVKNVVLWKTIAPLLGIFIQLGIDLKVSWVRGHNGNEYNEKCDKLAHATFQKLTKSKESNEV